MQYTFRALITIETDEPQLDSEAIKEVRNQLTTELEDIELDVELEDPDADDDDDAYRTISISVKTAEVR